MAFFRPPGGSSTDTQLYDILGVTKTAPESEIKRAYHRLAKEFHPDKNPRAGDKFKEISFAYDVLSDPRKKEVYDRFGMKGLQEGGGGGGQDFGEFGFPGDLFSDFFGGGGGGGGPSLFNMFGGGGGHHSHRQRRSEDSVKPLKVTLEDLYLGKTHTIKHQRKATCRVCSGVGSANPKNTKPCTDCRGSGMKMEYRQLGPGLVQQIHRGCTKCSGQGTVIPEKDRCKKCEGNKIVDEVKDIEVHVDKGMSHGTKIVVRGEGDEEVGVQPGDLIFVLQQVAHDVFERSGDNLVMNRSISLTESLCGFQFVIQQLDGRNLVISRTPGHVVPNGTIHMVPGEGMPQHKRPFEKGNLIVKFKVEFPQNHFTDEKSLAMLETLLPPRAPFVKPEGDHVEEVGLSDYIPHKNDHTGEDDDDDDPRGARIGCAQQ